MGALGGSASFLKETSKSFGNVVFDIHDSTYADSMSGHTLHLSHVKQIYSQPYHLKHELILCIQVKRGRVDF